MVADVAVHQYGLVRSFALLFKRYGNDGCFKLFSKTQITIDVLIIALGFATLTAEFWGDIAPCVDWIRLGEKVPDGDFEADEF
jgi:hypothetical protein